MASRTLGRRRPAPEIAPPQAVLYARVSTPDQERDGFSIPAQQKLLRDYAETHGVQVAAEYVDVETAKSSGRTNFGEMIRFLKRSSRARVILVEKTDRLYRNIKDWVTIDELDVEIHFVKEGTVVSRDSRSSEKFMHGIKVLMAKNYSDNLSEETRKGMLEKAEQGIWPTVAPLGYRNVLGPNGKRVIEVDEEAGPIVTSLFEHYATGLYSLKEATRLAQEKGLTFRKTGRPVPKSTVHIILRNRLYTGEFEWNGKKYQGTHEPLVPIELWERVQGVLDGRNATKIHTPNDLAFTGVIKCGHCGCALVGDVKKRKYVYYRCSGYKGACGEPYVREEVLTERFAELLAALRLDDDLFELLRRALHESHDVERQDQEAQISRHQAEAERNRRRLEMMYMDRLDGVIGDAFYSRISAELNEAISRANREIENCRIANESYMEDGVRLLELAQKAESIFLTMRPHEKRQLLSLVLSNCTWARNELTPQFREPFGMIAENAKLAAAQGVPVGAILGQNSRWLPGLDAYRTGFRRWAREMKAIFQDIGTLKLVIGQELG